MKVILLQNIKGIGRIGDVKNVSDGYGRNYLLANQLAKKAADGALKDIEALKKKAEAQEKLDQERATLAAEKMKDLAINFTRKASSAGTLFASITAPEIAKELSKISGYKIDSDMIDLSDHDEHIKHEGDHMITVRLSPDQEVGIKISVKGEVTK